MADTKIEWADKVWNPIAGCTKCSPGCLNCYAERMALRLRGMGIYPYHQHPDLEPIAKNGWTGIITCNEKALNQPFHWRKPKRIFVCSMSDLFHEKVPFEFINKVFAVAALCPQHTFLILTKRIGRAKEYMCRSVGKVAGSHTSGDIQVAISNIGFGLYDNWQWPLSNVYFGVSISNQIEADEKIPILLQIPAAVRWLSIEPMLEGIDLSRYVFEECRKVQCKNCGSFREADAPIYMCGECGCGEGKIVDPNCEIDGVVVGGESGPGARPMQSDWARNIRDQCVVAVVAGVP